MRYMGSKARHAKHILPIILKERQQEQFYVEPFVGGGNLIDKVSGPRIGNDSNKYVIALLKAIQNGWIPPDSMSKDEYVDIKNNRDMYPDYLVGFAGFSMSFAGKFFGGYTFYKKGSFEQDFCGQQKKYCLNQKNGLIGVNFISLDYKKIHIPKNSIIYCDPPYNSTTKYKNSEFDHTEFWNWAEDKKKEGHNIFVSEYNAPSNWDVLWEKEISSSLTPTENNKRATEKLFTLRK